MFDQQITLQNTVSNQSARAFGNTSVLSKALNNGSFAEQSFNGMKRKFIPLNENAEEVFTNSAVYVNPMQAKGFYEQFIMPVLLPKTIPFAKKYEVVNQAGALTVKTSDVGIQDMIKPHRGVVADDTMEKATAFLADFANFQIDPQDPRTRNMYNNSLQPQMNESSRASVRMVSYAFSMKYNVHQQSIVQQHEVFGSVDNIAQQQALMFQLFEKKYQYDLFSSRHPLYKDYTILEQAGDTVIADLGIPNTVDGLADSTLTADQFQTLVFKLKAIYNNIQQSTTEGNTPNIFILDTAGATKMMNQPFYPVSSQVNNQTFAIGTYYGSKLAFLVNELASIGVSVFASNQLNPTSKSVVLDPQLEATLTPSNPVPVGNDTDRPIYLMLNDNSGLEQDIIYAPKRRVLTVDYQPADPLGQEMIMGVADVATNINFARPQFSRRKITVGGTI